MGEEGWVQGVYGDEPAICYIKQTIGCNGSPINKDNFKNKTQVESVQLGKTLDLNFFLG